MGGGVQRDNSQAAVMDLLLWSADRLLPLWSADSLLPLWSADSFLPLWGGAEACSARGGGGRWRRGGLFAKSEAPTPPHRACSICRKSGGKHTAVREDAGVRMRPRWRVHAVRWLQPAGRLGLRPSAMRWPVLAKAMTGRRFPAVREGAFGNRENSMAGEFHCVELEKVS
jgi:hypothetical protein